jgi:hypothetical protein
MLGLTPSSIAVSDGGTCLIMLGYVLNLIFWPIADFAKSQPLSGLALGWRKHKEKSLCRLLN